MAAQRRFTRVPAAGPELPYHVQRPLHFSNAGGVYLAADRTTGEQVVLREARPHAGLDRTGMDAVARLERERATLTRLAGLDCVPRLLGHHLVWEHHFLVEEYVEGQTLLEAIISRHPYTHPHPTADELTEYQGWAADVMTKIADALHVIHRRGIRYGDLQPANVILRPDGRVVLVELAAELSDAAPAPLGTAGFAAPRDLSGPDVDWYAWECLRLFVLLPLTQLLDRDPRKALILIDAAGELFETAPLHRPRLLRYLRHAGTDQADHAAAIFAAAEPDWPAIRDSLIAGIHASATPERTDRLFPGDPTQYVSHGVALGTGAAGVLLALHQVGTPVPTHYVDWLVTAASRASSSLRRGLYDGLHGVAAVLDTLGRPNEALEILDLARAKGDRAPTAGLFGGRAGIALNLLHFAARTGDDA
ncbi:MAG: protein kinase domain-containing protein, partial [Pseudonocardiaceae bacterium]